MRPRWHIEQLLAITALLLLCPRAAGQAVVQAPLSLGARHVDNEAFFSPQPSLPTWCSLMLFATVSPCRRSGTARHPGLHHQLAGVFRRQQPQRLGGRPVHSTLPVHGCDVRCRRAPQLSVSCWWDGTCMAGGLQLPSPSSARAAAAAGQRSASCRS